MLAPYQIELTTRCQFNCWYCAGRVMPQKDMEWDTFQSIIDKIPKGSKVSLQGEGEPTLWPHWWRGVDAVLERGLRPEVITNGVAIDAEQFAAKFPVIHVSMDTMNPNTAESKIGRFNLMKVIGNVIALSKYIDNPSRVILISVRVDESDEGWRAVQLFAMKHGMQFKSQPLQRKEDYVAVYKRPYPLNRIEISSHVSCDVRKAGYKYWNVDGKELPCCFIKQAGSYERARFDAQWDQGYAPPECRACSQIKPSNPTKA